MKCTVWCLPINNTKHLSVSLEHRLKYGLKMYYFVFHLRVSDVWGCS